LCQETKTSYLNEITRTVSNNLLDYILIDNEFLEKYFVTSYNNFISDHNSTVLRFGLDENEFTNEIKERITFDMESHLKRKMTERNSEGSSTSSGSENLSHESLCSMASDISEHSGSIKYDIESDDQDVNVVQDQKFMRKFKNTDMSSCWLNSCIQLILSAMDHSESQDIFTSELGMELLHLQRSEQSSSLDSINVIHILVTSEDTRIAIRISELATEIDDPIQLEIRTDDIQSLRLNLISGQQCVRDFFLCINDNFLSWPDVYLFFRFEITHSTSCSSCNNINQSETSQMYAELQVPPDYSNLSDFIEEFFNRSSLVGVYCETSCKSLVQAEKSSKVTRTADTEFITVILTRAVETLDGFKINKDRTIATNGVLIR
jgi:hypothetical protein